MKLIYCCLTKHLNWILYVGVVFSIKCLILYFDPTPMLFLGDSGSYILTALNGWIPPDRSFVYGYIIRYITALSHTLTALIAFQVLLSTFTSLIAAYSLKRFFLIRTYLAYIIGILCAIEPLQLLYERYILTETVSLFVFTIYMTLIFQYIKEPKLSLILVIQVVGTALISLRLSFLPFIWVNTFIVPILNMSFYRKNFLIKSDNKLISFLLLLWERKLILGHLLISFISVICFHAAYKQLNGFLINSPPAYQYKSGLFLMADWAPIIKPIDFPKRELSELVFGNLKFDINDRNTRGPQRWMLGGIVSNLNNIIPNEVEADKIAKATAINALIRDPFGIVVLALNGFTDYWDRFNLEKCMLIDQGGKSDIPPLLLKSLKINFGLYAENLPTQKTFTNTYYFAVWPWYLVLICTPFFSMLCLFFCDDKLWKQFFIIFIATSTLVIIASLLIERSTIRYLHALTWLFFIILGVVLDKIISFLRKNITYD